MNFFLILFIFFLGWKRVVGSLGFLFRRTLIHLSSPDNSQKPEDKKEKEIQEVVNREIPFNNTMFLDTNDSVRFPPLPYLFLFIVGVFSFHLNDPNLLYA